MPISYVTTTASTSTPIHFNDSGIDDEKIIDVIVNNWDIISKKMYEAELQEEQRSLKEVQKRNRYYRHLIKYVHWSGRTCVVYWNDGTWTKSHWSPEEFFDPEKAILVCMARKLYGNTNIYNEVLQEYAESGWDHYEKENFFLDENKDLDD